MQPGGPARRERSLAETLRRTPLLASAAVGWIVGDALGGCGFAPAPLLLAGVAGAACLALCLPAPATRRVALALLAAVWAAVAAYQVVHPHLPADHVALAPMHTRLLLDGVLAEGADGAGERARLTLDVTGIDDGGGWQSARGRVRVSLRHAWRAWPAGARVEMPVTLRRPRNFGNPGEFDYAGYLARRGVYVTGYAEDDAAFRALGMADGGGLGWLARWRRGVGELFRQTLPAEQAAVLSALIVGTDSTLPRELRTTFSRAGVSHVLSISGLHVGLVAAAGYALFRWLLARSRWLLLTANVPKLAVGLSVLPVLLYAGIAGSNVATVRAVLMILVFLGAVLVDRQRHLVVSLAVAAIAILMYSPSAALDISFQLSFVAVLGLLYANERFWPWWTRWEAARLPRAQGWRWRMGRGAAISVVISASALAATLPLAAFHFNQVSLVALLANAVVVPVLGSAAVTVGLLAALAYGVSFPVARLLVVIAGPIVQLGVWLVEACAALPFAAVHVVTPTLLELGLAYGALLAVLRLSGRRRLAVIGCVALLGAADGVWWYADRYQHADLRLTFLSVGQGDSAVVELPGGEVMVVDGGGLSGDGFDVGERVIAPFLWSRKIARVDYLVLSHPQWDHYGGFAFLAAEFAPREFWWNGTDADSIHWASLQELLRAGGVRRLVMHRGDRRRLGNVEAEVRSPPARLDGLSINDQSLVLSLRFGRARVLFSGDIEAPAEAALVAAGDGALASTVLKVPHHGSHTSSTADFLDAVEPRLAVVSVGFENQFHFPHRDVLRRYAQRRIRLARTDLEGAVSVRLDGAGMLRAHAVTATWPPPAIGVDSLSARR